MFRFNMNFQLLWVWCFVITLITTITNSLMLSFDMILNITFTQSFITTVSTVIANTFTLDSMCLCGLYFSMIENCIGHICRRCFYVLIQYKFSALMYLAPCRYIDHSSYLDLDLEQQLIHMLLFHKHTGMQSPDNIYKTI